MPLTKRLNTLRDRMRERSDEELVEELERARDAVREFETSNRFTRDEAVEYGGNWVETTRRVLSHRFEPSHWVTRQREAGFDSALDLVTLFVLDSPDFADWLAGKIESLPAEGGAHGLSVLTVSEREKRVSALRREAQDVADELQRRELDVLRSQAERRYAELEAAVAGDEAA
jgi:hypothetical protein